MSFPVLQQQQLLLLEVLFPLLLLLHLLHQRPQRLAGSGTPGLFAAESSRAPSWRGAPYLLFLP